MGEFPKLKYNPYADFTVNAPHRPHPLMPRRKLKIDTPFILARVEKRRPELKRQEHTGRAARGRRTTAIRLLDSGAVLYLAGHCKPP